MDGMDIGIGSTMIPPPHYYHGRGEDERMLNFFCFEMMGRCLV